MKKKRKDSDSANPESSAKPKNEHVFWDTAFGADPVFLCFLGFFNVFFCVFYVFFYVLVTQKIQKYTNAKNTKVPF